MSIYELMMHFCVKGTRSFFKFSNWKHSFGSTDRAVLTEMATLPKEGIGRDLFIILNGPSLKNQDLSLLKGKDLMFVNRGFMHPLYKELQPKYHAFVDSKLISGVWPLEWLDQIFELSPGIRIILPIKWNNHPHLARFKNDKRIFWQSWTIPFYVNGVSNNCFSYGISQRFENIFFTGFDGNSCAFDMIKSSESHFYGSDPELSDMTSKQHAHALFTTFLQLEDLRDFSKYCIKKHINIYNLTDGGVLDMFIRRDFNNPYDKSKEISIGPNVL